MSWIVFALISVITTSIATLLGRLLLKDDDSNPTALVILFQFTLGIITLFFALLLGRFVWPNSEVSTGRFIVSSILWASTSYFSFQTLKYLGAGESIILISNSVLVSIFLGVMFLGERFSITSSLGVILILSSVLIVNHQKLTFNSKKGVIYGLITAFLSGTAVANDAIIIRTYETFSYTALLFFSTTVLLSIFFSKELPAIKKIVMGKSFKMILVIAFLSSIQALAYNLAYEFDAPVSKLSVISKSSIILTVVLAALFLKEKSGFNKKILASILVTLGVILLG